MIIAALFPHCSHMPPERTEKKQGRKKGLQGETPGESRDDIKARTAAQKLEQQEQRAKARQRALEHAAPQNVHHMSTRQKAQTTGSSKKEITISIIIIIDQPLALAHRRPHRVNWRMINKKNRKHRRNSLMFLLVNLGLSQPAQQSAQEPGFSLKLTRRLPKKTPRLEGICITRK